MASPGLRRCISPVAATQRHRRSVIDPRPGCGSRPLPRRKRRAARRWPAHAASHPATRHAAVHPSGRRHPPGCGQVGALKLGAAQIGAGKVTSQGWRRPCWRRENCASPWPTTGLPRKAGRPTGRCREDPHEKSAPTSVRPPRSSPQDRPSPFRRVRWSQLAQDVIAGEFAMSTSLSFLSLLRPPTGKK